MHSTNMYFLTSNNSQYLNKSKNYVTFNNYSTPINASPIHDFEMLSTLSSYVLNGISPELVLTILKFF